jgi:hypothetical protein
MIIRIHVHDRVVASDGGERYYEQVRVDKQDYETFEYQTPLTIGPEWVEVVQGRAPPIMSNYV